MLSPYPQSRRPGVARGWRLPVRGWRLPVLVLLSVAALLPVAAPAATRSGPGAPPPTTTPDPPRVPGLWMPVTGVVIRGFDARAGPYGPGHRGIDIAAPVGATVRAPAAGRIVFAGPVAGTTWVTLLVAQGVRVTLGPLLDPVAVGRVPSKAPLGRVGSGHRVGSTEGAGSGPAATLHLSVRVDGVYVDPLAYLIDRPRPRLAPLPEPAGLPPEH
jgi:murein DD-endopeptidase MepM/ murein hydrolase activator NlpD